MSNIEVSEYYTVDQAAEKLGCNPETVRRHIRSGRIIAIKLSGKGAGQYMISKEQIDIREAEIVEPNTEACVNEGLEPLQQQDYTVVLNAINELMLNNVKPLSEQQELIKNAIVQQQQIISTQRNEIAEMKKIVIQQSEMLDQVLKNSNQGFFKKLFGK